MNRDRDQSSSATVSRRRASLLLAQLMTRLTDSQCPERREDHGKREVRNHSGSRRDEQRGQGGDNGDCGQVQELTEEYEGS